MNAQADDEDEGGAVEVEPLARRRMGREVERVLEAIVGDITTGAIRPGAKLNGPELSRRLGVSRGPLREAIRRLEERQLVQCTPNAGARVVLHSPEEVIQFFYVREALEGMAARLAARTMSDADLADLRGIYEGEVARGGTLGGRNDFHMRIVSGAYHPRLSRLLNEDFYTL
ncbi:MAG: GntR family transcriptional regulator, partial [Alphaproteobacteria bacterium]